MPRMWSLAEAKDDDHALRHGHTQHEGTDCGDNTMEGTYMHGQYCPMFFNREGATMHLEGMYRGGDCFLIGGGPSLAKIDQQKMKLPGCLTFAINNSVKVIRPNMWTCVDDPSRFLYSIWKDPQIMKFVPMAHFSKDLWDSTNREGVDNWKKAPVQVQHCPNVWGYRRNEKFAAHRFLTENTINWGCHKDHGGCRSVMLAAIRIIYLLGIRRLFLVGVDLNMSPTAGYAFAEGRSAGAIKNNNTTYARMINEYFPALKPQFDKAGFQVFNCNPDSALKIFPHIPYEEAIKVVTAACGDTTKEKTEGMYLKLTEKLRVGSQAECFKATQGKVEAVED
jgi:hypothetical protein